MNITPRQLSACTFPYAAYVSYFNNIQVSVVIGLCFFTSLWLHRPRPSFGNDYDIIDYIDPMLARMWAYFAISRCFYYGPYNRVSQTCVIITMLCCMLRTKYRYNSITRNILHCTMHISSTIGTVAMYRTV